VPITIENFLLLQKISKISKPEASEEFLELIGYFRKFIKDYALIARSLNDLLKKELGTRIARWKLLLSKFNYAIKHRAGARMHHVDSLNR